MMFNLETAISTWKNALKHNRAFLPEDIEELEGHIRDHVHSACEAGLSEEEGYRRALKEIGDLMGLETEYKKVFWSKVLTRTGAVKEIILEVKMLINYLKIAFRNLLRYKGYTSINIIGLAAGIACFIVIGLFVKDELSYDRHNEHADSIVRVLYGEKQIYTPTAVAPEFSRRFPEVVSATRIFPIGMFNSITVRKDEKLFEESGFISADSTLFDVFTLQIVAGQPENALNRPQTIAISRTAALKYFNRIDPIGETLNVSGSTDFEVTAVFEDLPSTSHVHFSFVTSFVSYPRWSEREIWDRSNFFTYLRLQDARSMEPLQNKIDAMVAQLSASDPNLASEQFFFTLQRLTDIRLKFEGRERYVFMFSAIGLLILLVACANYINLATARASRRAREVGIRKVSGAHRGHLMRQFFGESMLMVLIASILAVVLVFISIGPLNAVSGKEIALSLWNLKFWGLIVGLGVIMAGLSGVYPAIMLSSYQPATVLKSASGRGTGSSKFRNVLVVFQFVVTVFLLVGTFVVKGQLSLMQDRDFGFEKDHVVVLSMNDAAMRSNYESIKSVLQSQPYVQAVSAIQSTPGYQFSGYGMETEESDLTEQVPGGGQLVNGITIDDDVVNVLGLHLIAGSNFPDDPSYTPSDGQYRYLVNEQLVRSLNWDPDEAVGKKINLTSGRVGEIFGVYQDYHYQSLHNEINAQALFIDPSQFRNLMIKLRPDQGSGSLTASMASLQKIWKDVAPQKPFSFKFLDDEFDALYKADVQISEVISVFSVLAVLIACLGFIGLASFTAERKTKEIGVRKVMGATVGQIYLLMTKDLVLLVGIAFAIATPFAWYFLNKWLENFSFRLELTVWTFLTAGLVVLLIAVITVSYQALRASYLDPVKSLRYE